MWRLGMSLEDSTIHVGEKVQLAGGVIKADVQGLWRGSKALHRHASGIVTSKTKTIYRSKSAQFYIFIQLCQETWEFDEDGERYSEKIVHGKSPKCHSFKKLISRFPARAICQVDQERHIPFGHHYSLFPDPLLGRRSWIHAQDWDRR